MTTAFARHDGVWSKVQEEAPTDEVYEFEERLDRCGVIIHPQTNVAYLAYDESAEQEDEYWIASGMRRSWKKASSPI